MNRLGFLALGAVVIAASCSVAGNGELEQIDSADLFGLDETTTSTTAVPTTPTVATPTPVEPTFGVTTTVATEPVELYFVDGNQLAAVAIPLLRGPSPLRVVTALLDGPPPGPASIGLRSALPDDLVNTVEESGAGYVTVDLVGEAFQRIDPADQRSAIGQLVLTLTQRPGVGQVRFTRDGVLARVPFVDGFQSEPGEPVSRQDYEALLNVVPEATAGGSTTTVAPAPSAPGT